MNTGNEILLTITKEDLQEEANHYLGRNMNDEEYQKAKKLFEYGIGENMSLVLQEVFYELLNNKE